MKGKPLAGIKSPSSVQFQSFLYLHLGFLTRTERLSKLEREMHYYWEITREVLMQGKSSISNLRTRWILGWVVLFGQREREKEVSSTRILRKEKSLVKGKHWGRIYSLCSVSAWIFSLFLSWVPIANTTGLGIREIHNIKLDQRACLVLNLKQIVYIDFIRHWTSKGNC